MGYVIKTLIWYSSRFDPTSVGARIISGLSPSCTCDIRSNNDLLEALDISLIANNGKFQEIARNYLNKQRNIADLFNFLLERGSATQLLGFGSLLKTMGNKGDAFRVFTKDMKEVPFEPPLNKQTYYSKKIFLRVQMLFPHWEFMALGKELNVIAYREYCKWHT